MPRGERTLYEQAYRLDQELAMEIRGRDLINGLPKTVKITSKSAAYNQTTFYEAWRLIIQRYGIFNPYTGRGAIGPGTQAQ